MGGEGGFWLWKLGSFGGDGVVRVGDMSCGGGVGLGERWRVDSGGRVWRGWVER